MGGNYDVKKKTFKSVSYETKYLTRIVKVFESAINSFVLLYFYYEGYQEIQINISPDNS